jgi:hypothetical protein
MRYPDGQSICLGDKVSIGEDSEGTVVCSIDTNEYSDEYPKAEWGYLNRGVLIRFPLRGLIHYEEEPDSDIILIERAKKN